MTDGLSPFVLGGMQAHSSALVREFLNAGCELVVFHTIYTGSKIQESEVYRELGLTKANCSFVFKPFEFKKKLFPGGYIRASIQYSETVFKEIQSDLGDFDFIYAQGFTGISFVRRKSTFNTPVITNLHGLNMFQKTFGIRSWLEAILLKPIAKECLKCSDFVVSLGGKLSDLLVDLGIPKEKILVAPNGVEASWLIEKERIKSQGSVVKLVFIGRDDKVKGLSTLLQVYSSLGCEKLRLTIIGPVEHEPMEYVHFLGEMKNKEDIIRVLDDSDILICPSYSEGMPTVVLEGMSRGLAIIASDVGATSELVDSQNGWLIEAGNKNELRQALIEASSMNLDPLKRASRERIEEFIFTRLVRDFLKKVTI